MSLRFLFLFNLKIGRSAKISFRFGSISKVCEFLSIIVTRLVEVVVKVSTQLRNLSGNQLLLLIHLGSFELFSDDPKYALCF